MQMFDYLCKPSQQILTQKKTSAQEWQNIFLPEQKSLIDMFLFSQGEDEKINARWYWKVLRW